MTLDLNLILNSIISYHVVLSIWYFDYINITGLHLVLNIDQSEYIPFLTPGAGVRVRIHELNSAANLQEQGSSIPAGFESSIGVKQV